MIDLDESLDSDSDGQECDPGHPRAVFVLGAGFSQAVSSQMLCTDDLGKRICATIKDLPPNLTRGTSFEDWLSRLAEPQPDQSIESNLLRQSHFHSIVRTMAAELEAAQDKSISLRLPAWLYQFITVAHFWQSTLISFNYDTLIEHTTPGCQLQMRNPVQIPPTIPLSSGDAIGQMPPLPNGPSRAPFPSFRLLKLHGSLAWSWDFGDTTGLTIARMPIDNEEELANTIVKTSSGVFGDARAMIAEPPEDAMSRKARLLPNRTHFIAPPSGPKSSYYQNPFMAQLWKNARLALENADEVYFVGYSMPRADATARGLLRESLRPNAKIIVVNTAPELIVQQIDEWGLKVDGVHDEPNCVEQMVEVLEDRRGKEAITRLKQKFTGGDFDLEANPSAAVKPFGSSSGKEWVKRGGIEERRLILQESSDQEGAMTIPELFELISRKGIEGITIRSESAECEQRVVHYEFEWNSLGTITRVPSNLLLRVATRS